MSVAIGMMCKPPRAGVSKTRLAAYLGPELAAKLSAAFLRDVGVSVAAACEISGAVPYALYCPADAEDELHRHLPGQFPFMLMQNSDLGNTMLGAVSALLARGHEGVILVGSDFPTLPWQILQLAVEHVSQPADRIVLGPSADGGYYLIGMRKPHASVFQGVPWSTGEVFGQTLKRADEAGLSVEQVPAWYDVDDGTSFALLCEDLAGRARGAGATAWAPGPAAATLRVLQEHGLLAAASRHAAAER